MTTTKAHDERIRTMKFGSVYPHYVAKVEKKGRTEEELHQVITWLTGFDAKDLKRLIENEATFERFFAEATLNPNASLITGTICGYRIEEIGTPTGRDASLSGVRIPSPPPLASQLAVPSFRVARSASPMA